MRARPSTCRSWRGLLALGSLAALSLSACGSDGDGDGAGSGPSEVPGEPSSTTTGVTGPTSSPTTSSAAPTAVPPGDPVARFTPIANDGGDDVGTAVDLATRPGDPALYVVSQEGRITPVRDGAAGDPVLDITDRTTAGGERGLLGLAFSPTAPLAYVYYTDEGGKVVIDEYALDGSGRFDEGSRRQLLSLEHPYANHNGGALRFGPDGLLYIGIGDGGSGGDPDRRALDPGDLLGKVLRIDPRPSGDQPYTVPADNPFVGVPGARPEVWSIGLRNPWRLNFDLQTGDLWIADVGQDEWEEIDLARAADGAGRGANFGWSAFEGSHPYNADQPTQGAIAPIFEYEHGDAGCSISGGARYRGTANPTLAGWYVYGDYCSGHVWALQVDGDAAGRNVELGTQSQVVSVAQDASGELYVLTLDGPVFRLDP